MIPALRRPKALTSNNNSPIKFMILTLKNGKKLVVSSDSFHSIMNIEHKYNCMVCQTEFDFDDEHKANHKKLETHKQKLTLYPHKEDFEENLIRQLDTETCYCTICGVSLSTHSLMRHLSAGVHKMELIKAKNRAYTYKPLE